VARKVGLPWQASSRGLALERGVNSIGPMAVAAITALEALGVRAADAVTRLPAQVTTDDLEQADRIVALKQAEHLPLLQERFPAWVEKAEFWQVDDAPEVLALIERRVMDLPARLVGGGRRRGGPALEAAAAEASCPRCRRPAAPAPARRKEVAKNALAFRLKGATLGGWD
jgi:protein-tyrosine phosphatase